MFSITPFDMVVVEIAAAANAANAASMGMVRRIGVQRGGRGKSGAAGIGQSGVGADLGADLEVGYLGGYLEFPQRRLPGQHVWRTQ